jgi:hypothetical protein
VTVTLQVSVLFLTFAVIVQVPDLIALTLPALVTVAIFLSEEVHLTVLDVFFTVKVLDAPTLKESFVLLSFGRSVHLPLLYTVMEVFFVIVIPLMPSLELTSHFANDFLVVLFPLV